jgi:antitoxin component of MazEF toxin-antitoxin module
MYHMETTVNKWGNSLAVRIPSKLTKGFLDGTRIRVERKGDSLIIRPELNSVPSIENLV